MRRLGDLVPIPELWEGPCLSFPAWERSQCLLGVPPGFGRAGPRPPASPEAQPWLAFPRRPLQLPSQALPGAAQILFSNIAAKDRAPHQPLKIRPPVQAGTRAEEGCSLASRLQHRTLHIDRSCKTESAQRPARCRRSWVGGGDPGVW